MWTFVLSVITFVEFIKSRAKKCKTKSLVFWNMAGKTVMALFFYFLHTFLLPTLPDAFPCLASLFETFRCFKQQVIAAAGGRSKGLILQFLTVYLEAVPLILL